MAKLPNGDKAYIPPHKLTGYLLSETHLVGKSKARFSRALGFDETTVGLLEQGLLEIALAGEVKEQSVSPYGVKYVVDGILKAPAGFTAPVRTIWIVEKGQERPGFVTAYPLREK